VGAGHQQPRTTQRTAGSEEAPGHGFYDGSTKVNRRSGDRPLAPADFPGGVRRDGARRGEILALRWSDIEDGRVTISRSLTQTKQILEFKGTKTEDSARPVSLPPGTFERSSDR
jgi:hypothetical protein